MMSTRKTYRLGTTAIAAVLALSATQLAAQGAPATDAPVVETPTVATTPTEPTTTVDPLAPAAEPEVTTPTDTAQATEAADAAPVTKTAAKKPAAKPKSSAQRTAAKSSVPAAPAPAAAVEANAEPATPPAPAVAPAPMAEATPVAEVKPADKKLDEAVPLAGGAGAVILALAGAGMAVRRRKRREEEEEFEQSWSDEPVMGAEAAPELEPAWDPPVVAPKPVAAALTSDLPEDFDTSKFGRHVQAAYEGPTPENPSLSLRKRLKVAGELDRRERLNGIAPEPTKPAAVRTETPQSMSFMFSGTPAKQKWPEPQL